MAKVKELPNPALALKKERHEALAQNLAKGMQLAEAYINASNGVGTPDSAKVSAHRIKSTPIFQQRLNFLLEQARQRENIALQSQVEVLPENFGKDDIATLFVEVLQTLEDCYQVAQNSAVPPIRLEQLRATMSSHGARMNSLAEEGGEVPVSNFVGLERDVERLNSWETCKCLS